MKERNERRSFLKHLFSLSAFIAGSSLSFNKNKEFKNGKIRTTEALGMGSTGKNVKKIAVEEHYCTEEYSEYSRAKMRPMMQDMMQQGMMQPEMQGAGRGEMPLTDKQIKEVEYGEGRIKEMDECGIDMQVLSLTAPELDIFDTPDAIAMAKDINDETSEIIKRYPKRFSGYCSIPLQDPEAAADELERAVTKLGLKGVSVQADMAERSFADKKYEVIFERLARLDVPMYLHIREPLLLMNPNLSGTEDVIRLISCDLLDKYPGLKFILGHGGEAIPFYLYRLDGRWKQSNDNLKRPKIFSQYFKDNFYVSTSSQCWPTLLQFLIAALGAERILFATDYPYESTKQHVDFIDSAPISDSDREKICHLNAESLFRL